MPQSTSEASELGRLVDDMEWQLDPDNAAQTGLWEAFRVPGTAARPNYNHPATGDMLDDLASGALLLSVTVAQLLDVVAVMAGELRVLRDDAEPLEARCPALSNSTSRGALVGAGMTDGPTP